MASTCPVRSAISLAMASPNRRARAASRRSRSQPGTRWIRTARREVQRHRLAGQAAVERGRGRSCEPGAVTDGEQPGNAGAEVAVHFRNPAAASSFEPMRGAQEPRNVRRGREAVAYRDRIDLEPAFRTGDRTTGGTHRTDRSNELAILPAATSRIAWRANSGTPAQRRAATQPAPRAVRSGRFSSIGI